MFNPFKKKDTGSYKLDEYKVPSLSESSSTPPSDSPPTPTSSSSGPDFSLSTPPSSDGPSLSSLTPSTPDPSSSLAPSFGSASSDTSAEMDVDSIHGEVSRVKIDSIDAKISLLDAKMTTIESKMDMILAVLKEEISDETKRKLQIDSMVDTIKRRNF